MVNYKSKGKCKAYIRGLIKSLIDKINPQYVFTLPNLNYDVENYAISKGSKVICCEINKDIYNTQLTQIPQKIELYNTFMSNIVDKYVYDIAWLDACGPISKELINSIYKLKLSDKGYIIVTVGLAREHPSFNIPNNKIQYYIDLLASFGYYTYEIYKYRDYKFPMAAYFCSKELKDTVDIHLLN